MNNLVPTEGNVRAWMTSVLQHSCHVEYFLGRLDIDNDDPQRPHDLVGPGNKYEWDVLSGLALQYQDPTPDFETYILPALNLHRQQFHHQKWNEPNPMDKTKRALGVSRNDMFVGAVDAVCSLLENRGYQGGVHDYDAIVKIARTNPPHKNHWMVKMIPRMAPLEQPKLERIASLGDFPNIGLQRDVYDAIVERTCEAVEILRDSHGYSLE